ncbi:MAG: NADP-dependent oxidoreductase [Alphaproteobacteria bacterium]|nr:MAG: NADP-dependent oxidoreductase [Alphaproteobacteria bacterium]
MKNDVNNQWVLAKRPVGMVKTTDFEQVESQIGEAKDGEITVKVTHIAFEPAMRGWINEGDSYVKGVEIGEVMRAQSVGEVIESKNDAYKEGDVVSGFFGWQEFSTLEPSASMFPIQVLPEGVSPEMALSVLGITGLTAWGGMLEIGKPQEGDTVVVSGAAGATGNIAGQIAKIKGCRVIGIAGGPEKCQWLIDELGFDGAVDYKSENVSERLKELCPDGINIFFDNVGGKILEAALDNIATNARVVICGGIVGYNEEELPPGPRNYMQLVLTSSTMEGFLLGQFGPKLGQAAMELGQWVGEGKLKFTVDVQEGFDNVPQTFLRLFEGKNLGKQLCKVA